MSKQLEQFYEFGPFRIDVQQRLLLREGKVVPLTPKVFDTLFLLVENNGQLLEKKAMLDSLWPDTFVEEGSLTQNVSLLRRLLSEGQSDSQYIETLPRRGYRFVADVRLVESEASHVPRSTVVSKNQRIDDLPAVQNLSGGNLQTSSTSAGLLRVAALRTNTFKLGLIAAGAILLIVVVWLLVARRAESLPASPAEIRSIAILPFKEIGTSGEQSAIGQGMADALIVKFSNLRKVVVRPTSSVLKYSGPDRDALKAGRELAVESVLEGSIQQAGGRLRLSVQLLRVADGTSLWAENFDAQMSDMFGVQDAISSQVAQALSLQLSKEERERVRKRYTENTEAYQAYLKGRYLWNKRTKDALEGATNHFEHAIRIDPNYALAYSGLADCYHLNVLYGSGSAQEMYAKAIAATTKALELDETLSEAHISLADIKHEFEWDFSGAEKEYRRALELNPNYSTGRQWYAQFLSNMGRHDEAIAEINHAMKLDPTALVISGAAADVYSNAGRHDQALQQLQKTLKIDPSYPLTYAFMARVFERKGMYSEALDALEKGWTLDYREEKLKVLAARRQAFRQKGGRGYWQKLLELETAWGGLDSFAKAEIHARLGENEQALEWLERATTERLPGIARIKIEPAFDPLRNDQRFKELLRRVGFDA